MWSNGPSYLARAWTKIYSGDGEWILLTVMACVDKQGEEGTVWKTFVSNSQDGATFTFELNFLKNGAFEKKSRPQNQGDALSLVMTVVFSADEPRSSVGIGVRVK